jgi:two-component system, NarL family, nitrate/nitrite response regulator NarL
MKSTKALIVDDHRLFAEVLQTSLEDLGLDVLPPVTNGADAMIAFHESEPDLALIDLVLPDVSGLELGRRMLAERPYVKAVAVTALPDTGAVAEAVRLGFSGYLTKDTPLSQFMDSVRSVLGGQVIVAHRPADKPNLAEDEEVFLLHQLTRRERTVLVLLMAGAGADAIAARLSVSRNTVRTHVQNILTKLQVHTRLEAVALASRHPQVIGRTWGLDLTSIDVMRSS